MTEDQNMNLVLFRQRAEAVNTESPTSVYQEQEQIKIFTPDEPPQCAELVIGRF